MMIGKIANLFNRESHFRCNKEIDSLKKTIQDLESVIHEFSRENHELRAIYDYRVLELEQAIEKLRNCEGENDGQ